MKAWPSYVLQVGGVLASVAVVVLGLQAWLQRPGPLGLVGPDAGEAALLALGVALVAGLRGVARVDRSLA